MPKPLFNWTPEFYDRLSGRYDNLARIFFSMGEKGKRRLRQNIPAGNILDIACGSGRLLADSFRVDLTCFGVDSSWGMLNQTRRKSPRIDLVQASFNALPFASECFTTVVETNAVSGVEHDVGQVLSEMKRVCRLGGEIRIADYAKAPKVSAWHRLMEWFGELFGDYAHDYAVILRSLGFEITVEHLGFDGMYQYVCARRIR